MQASEETTVLFEAFRSDIIQGDEMRNLDQMTQHEALILISWGGKQM